MELERFIKVQEQDYETALSEIKQGRKRSHWMWYIFPQLKGLGSSELANYYGLKNLEEAKDYLKHPVLGIRLIEISKALLALPSNDANNVMGSPDDMKLRSSMTLFALVPNGDQVFQNVLNKFYSGAKDELTIEKLSAIQA
ncbi:DUF1810 domain-containing protein [Mucilaginibacter aquatilis]|uniref:DUF1810 family protein n=1 Tax=Mucilaginibacter aquatilis TaxID=1517760 RepID=A0A6I4ICS6_9SPHI|nr:DUF1810 domain-containing protein [Mucilaginibacter aquatilis]MVN92962.1 DUF1810 family protein [Mucilaginibacter aquatilis]